MKPTLITLLLASAVTASAQEKMIVPTPPAGNVTLPLDEYNRLLTLATKPPRKTDAPPMNYAIQRADLKLRVTNTNVLGTTQLEGETFAKSSVKVPLVTGMTVLDARLRTSGPASAGSESGKDKPLPLQSEGSLRTAVLPGASEFSVTLESGLPLSIEAGRASFVLPVPAAGSARMTLVVPGDHANVRLSSGLITNRSSSNGQTTIEATLVPGQPTTIWWTTREVVAPSIPREVRFLSDVKTIVSVSDSDLRIAALADITVVQGEPSQFELALPPGYELTSATGATLDTSETQPGLLILKLLPGNQKSHQFLISLERSLSDTRVSGSVLTDPASTKASGSVLTDPESTKGSGSAPTDPESTKLDVPFLGFRNTQRETGEVLVEGSGTIEMTAHESGGLKRMDVKEVNPYLRSLVRFPMQSAFRYHRQPSESPSLTLDWVRFPDSSVLAAIAERAVVTTLVTSQGKSLTEVKLTVRNQAQPFLKLALPQGAVLLSAEVAGEKVKPVLGSDGSRVPLLRTGFRPNGPYEVSFVFQHAGTPFAKKGGSDLTLPKMDVPISLMQWEVFLPQQYKVRDFSGDVTAANLVPVSFSAGGEFNRLEVYGKINAGQRPLGLLTGQIGGHVTDPSGAIVPNATVTVQQLDYGVIRNTKTDDSGKWVVSSIPSGHVKVTVASPGFRSTQQEGTYEADRPAELASKLEVAGANSTVAVMVTADAPLMQTSQATVMSLPLKERKKEQQLQNAAPSANVTNFQRKVAGVLPVAVDVPRAGVSYSFVRPLVLNEETKLTFTYKTK
jgi:carboxypeptidase family protein